MRTQSRTPNDESRIADEIVSVLPAGLARACSPEKHTIRYSVRAEGMKLKTIVFSRESLQRLAEDPQRDVKVEYLKRDLMAAAAARGEFRYPRLHVHPAKGFPKRFALGLPLVATGC
ncbi:MAG TPA: hypothetical protein VM733_10140 [Thermoanaerobaculia bacterium]|nr:hypothetical protein [Thermoanaerobaculia bacterium]